MIRFDDGGRRFNYRIVGVAIHDGTVLLHRAEAPQRFPAAFEDCRAARDWIAEHGPAHGIRSEPMVVAGDSAGGNLAAAVALDARDRGSPRNSGQVLIYPALGGDMSKGSYLAHAQAPGLTTDDMRFYFSAYLGGSSGEGGGSKFAHPMRERDYRMGPAARRLLRLCPAAPGARRHGRRAT